MSQGIAQKLVAAIAERDQANALIYTDYLVNAYKPGQVIYKVRLTQLRRSCMLCNAVCPQDCLLLECSHGFCNTECLKKYCLEITENSLANLNEIYCRKCPFPLPRDLVVHAFGGLEAIERIKRQANDLKFKALMPDVFDRENRIEFRCEVCEEMFAYHLGVILDCKHRFCKDDFTMHVEIKIGDNLVSDEQLQCLLADCKTPIGYKCMKQYCDGELFNRYNTLLGNLIPVSFGDDFLL